MKFNEYILSDFVKNNYGFLLLPLPTFTDKVKKSNNASRYNFYTFLICEKGSVTQTVDDINYSLGAHQACLINYGQFHSIGSCEAKGFAILFTNDFYNLIYTENKRIRSDNILLKPPALIQLKQGLFNEMGILINSIMIEYDKVNCNKEIICMLLKVLMMMYTQARNNFIQSGDRKKSITTNYKALVYELYKEYKLPNEYAKRLFITANYLNTICKQVLGLTASKVIEERILLEAKRLLMHTNFSVSQISNELGFIDNSHFGKYFKRSVKMSPENYRILMKKNK